VTNQGSAKGNDQPRIAIQTFNADAVIEELKRQRLNPAPASSGSGRVLPGFPAV
jgi:hypothetical protein